ncbi:hypothetical protein [Geobacillus thermodenitrificans]|uniref:Uncharacterized protein n=1 Tax=Geobacillus thermodenitrificans TaxID=33940 RepID=A0ABY9Q6S5_GEOTD|nr:hypothetical protein [Geobacillus thermodenitrificans]WMV74600.1 hypothetical protein HSX42_09735 [Geobacillus thermodenitrificans]
MNFEKKQLAEESFSLVCQRLMLLKKRPDSAAFLSNFISMDGAVWFLGGKTRS